MVALQGFRETALNTPQRNALPRREEEEHLKARSHPLLAEGCFASVCWVDAPFPWNLMEYSELAKHTVLPHLLTIQSTSVPVLSNFCKPRGLT